MSKITMQTIADRLNISKVSVSNALSGKAGVSESTKNKVMQMARELGYHFDDPKTKKSVALLIPKRNLFSGNFAFYSIIVFKFIEIAAQEFNIKTIQITDKEEENLIIPNIKNFDFLVTVATYEDSYYKKLEEQNIPIIQVDTYHYPIKCDTVYYNNFLHGYQITSLLIEKGHKKIGFIGDFTSSSSRMDRYLGMRKALMRNNLEYNPDFHIKKNFHKASEMTTFPENLPTAFVCHSDMAAYNVMTILKERGYKIPEDISIVAFDNIEQSEKENFLTTIDINEEDLAKEAYKLLIWRRDHINHPLKIVTINGRLIERKSIKNLNL